MTRKPSVRLIRNMERLFDLGAVGMMSDTHLLDWFVSRNDETVEIVFEELVVRHGPMVLRICRDVLHNQHDAEDAFQAVFLVLANRAGAIRCRGSVASWLFGVAQRVAFRVKRTAARQHSLVERVAERVSEAYLPVERDLDSDILYEEIEELPERLRGPVVLCYLEGLSYDVASDRLGLSETTIRGRLSLARERLRHRLTKRGVTVPGYLIAGGPAVQWPVQATLSTTLVHSTIRVALGFVAGGHAAILARGVVDSMLLKPFKIAGMLLVLGILGSIGVWRTLLAATDDKHQVQSDVSAPRKDIVPVKSKTQTPKFPCQLTGVVRVEGTREPVAGAKFFIATGDVYENPPPSDRFVVTDAEGRFSVDLPVGNVRVWLSDPPVGYWVPNNQGFMESLAIVPSETKIHRDYVVRKGTVWNFRFIGKPGLRADKGSINGYNAFEPVRAQADKSGRVQLTLPTEGRKLTLALREFEQLLSQTETGQLLMNLEWEPNFRPDALKELSQVVGNDRQFRLVDVGSKSAMMQVPAPIHPINENGKLVIRVTLPDQHARVLGEVKGQVIDGQRKPIEGAQVALLTSGRIASSEMRHRAMTDAQGSYRLVDVPLQGIDDQPLSVRLSVAKKGYAGYDVPLHTPKRDDPQKPVIAEPIQLEPGFSVSGVVVDHRGQPLVGATVRSNQPYVRGGLSAILRAVQTDENGHFTLNDLHRGVTQLFTMSGKTWKRLYWLVDGSPEEVRIQLAERPDVPGAGFRAFRAAPPKPLAVGQAAPEWEVAGWSDGKDHKLASERGKIVVLYFWSTTFWQSVSVLPALSRLVDQFGPRGVEFLAIHHADLDVEHAQRLALKVLAFQGVKTASAIDGIKVPSARGMTAQEYGVSHAPAFVLIDRTGKIAFRSDTEQAGRSLATLFQELLRNHQSMTEEEVNQIVEKTLNEEIMKAMK